MTPPWLGIAEVVWICASALWILAERRAPTATLAWIFVLALLPIVGIPVYFFIGPRSLRRKRARYRGLAERVAASVSLPDHGREVPPDILRLVRLASRLDDAPVTTATRLALHHDGRAAFAALEAAIAAATHHLHLQFYIWDDDTTGRRMRDLLVERARAGIEVRVIVDGVGAVAGPRFFRRLVAAGGAWARFNPPKLGAIRSRFLNFRSHRKLLIADGRVGFLGGMNISDCQTIGWTPALPWRDSMLELEGRAVASLQRAFFEDWGFARRELLRADACYFPLQPDGERWLQVLRSGPDRDVFPIHELLFAAIASADERVWLTCPYVVPDESLLTALRSAAHRGVDVRLLVPQRGDSRLVQAAVRSYYADWLAAGVRVFEYQPAMLHAKTLVVDHELAVVGSANFDNRSLRLNFEIVAAVYGADVADALAATFLEDLGHAVEIEPRDLERRSRITCLLQDTARLFSIQL